MAIGYKGIPFRVPVDENGRVPKVVRRDRIRTFEAELLIAEADIDDLIAEEVEVTARPAIGGVNIGTIIIEGPGEFGNLHIPTSSGTEEVWRAALQSIEPLAPRVGTTWRCQVVFVCGNRTT